MNVAKKVWYRVHQPRVISTMHCLAYLVLLAAGVTSLISHPRSIEGVVGLVAMVVLSLLLILGGALGAPSALLGMWWLERVAVASVGFSASIYGVIVLALELQRLDEGNYQLHLAFILVVLFMQVVRWHRIRERPYDPDRHR